MSITIELVRSALSQVVDPNTEKDFITSRSAKNIQISGADVSLDIELGYPAKSQLHIIRESVAKALEAIPGIGKVNITIASK
ncbi:MAG: iron-sulfur cluster assembly protein, partial [bacterium]